MGTNITEMLEVLTAYSPSRAPRRVLDIGTQNVLNCTPAEVVAFIKRFNDVWEEDDLAAYAEVFAAGSAYRPDKGTIGGAWLGDLLTRAGMDYLAYDIFDGYRTQIFDLNREEIPETDRGGFDLVLNCGTTEHVINQYNSLKAIHDATGVGGLMYHAIPMVGYLDHGYFAYTPVLFRDLAAANEYEIVKLDAFGPQGLRPISAAMIGDSGSSSSDADELAARWRDAPVPNGLITVALRRTSPAPFRIAIEARTSGGAVVGRIQDEYGTEGSPARAESEGDPRTGRDKVDRWLASVVERFTDPDLDFREIQELYAAYVEAYPGRPFPPLIEKKALDLALLAYPERGDLLARLADVEAALGEQWPLFRCDIEGGEIDPALIAHDGVEAQLLALPFGRRQFAHAVTAFRGYIERGRPESFPAMLEFRALRYAAEELEPDNWPLRIDLGAVSKRLSWAMELRPKRPTDPSSCQTTASWDDRSIDHQAAADHYNATSGTADLDPGFVPIYERCREFSMTSRERMYALYKAIEYIEQAGIPGAIVECGVWRGGSMMVAALVLQSLGCTERDLFLFDTFEGLPRPEQADVDLWGNPAADWWEPTSTGEESSLAANAGLDEVEENLLSTGYPSERLHFVKGMVERTLPAQAPEQIALLRLDTDWYASTKHELEHLFPRLVAKGVLIIDDYGHFRGARQAVDEYIAQHRLPLLLNRIDYTGRLAIKTA